MKKNKLRKLFKHYESTYDDLRALRLKGATTEELDQQIQRCQRAGWELGEAVNVHATNLMGALDAALNSVRDVPLGNANEAYTQLQKLSLHLKGKV